MSIAKLFFVVGLSVAITPALASCGGQETWSAGTGGASGMGGVGGTAGTGATGGVGEGWADPMLVGSGESLFHVQVVVDRDGNATAVWRDVDRGDV